MTRTIKLLTLLCFALAVALPAFAQPRIATVDLRGVVTNYWRTKQFEAKLNDQKLEMAKELKAFEEDYKRLKEEEKKLDESTSEKGISESEGEKRKQAAAKKSREAKDLAETAQGYQRRSETTLAETMRRMLDSVLREVRAAINDKAKAGGYSLVIDVGGDMPPYNTPPVLYSTGEADITADVIAKLNSGAPVDFQKSGDKKPDSTEDKKGKK